MLEGLISFAWYGSYYGGDFGNILADWEALGIFDYMLPFLLIFALIFGILSKVNLFGDNNKKISGVIALAVALMALRFDVVPLFFSDIFPRLGVALAAVLVFIILLGLFGDPKNRGLLNTLMWASFGVAILIILQSTEIFFGGGIYRIFDLIPGWLVPVIILIVLVAIVAGRGDKRKEDILSTIAKSFGRED